MTRTRLVFALHFHQPFGNLDKVFDDAVNRCYRPTLTLLAEHPHVLAAVHASGTLLDWLERHRPEVLASLGELVARGQVELLGGGYQEPMLAILPDRDALGQLERMRDRCQELCGARPTGMWLAERVWEPDLARVIAQGGYRYTLLDDSHLHAAGAVDPLGAYYVTDKAGATVAVLPIDRGLRTRIPFADVDDLLDYLHANRGRVLTYGDDAEKFGLWPTTEQRVWREGWLRAFFEALGRESAWLETVHPTTMMASSPSAGPVYIPTIAYAEMGAWTLPARAAVGFSALGKRLDLAGFHDEAEAYLRGGIWQGFLAKYPESGLIYRKMLRVSAAVERARQAGHPRWRQAREALYRGQCNCAYWHGLFGGLYLQHLRAALTSTLLEAEALVSDRPGPVATICDHDGDLADDVLLESARHNLYLTPARGGIAMELDLCEPRFHLTGVLARRFEAYHVDVPRAQVIADEDLVNISAHDLVRATEEGLADRLVEDRHPRGAFVDHLLAPDTDVESFDRRYRPLADLGAARYRIDEVHNGVGEARVGLSAQIEDVRVDKTVRMTSSEIAVGYRLAASGAARSARFASEIDISLLSPAEDGGRRIEVESSEAKAEAPLAPGAAATHRGVTGVRIVAESLGVDTTVAVSPPATLWRIPIETVSQSERGFERAYQGTALVLSWPLALGEGCSFTAELRLR